MYGSRRPKPPRQFRPLPSRSLLWPLIPLLPLLNPWRLRLPLRLLRLPNPPRWHRLLLLRLLPLYLRRNRQYRSSPALKPRPRLLLQLRHPPQMPLPVPQRLTKNPPKVPQIPKSPVSGKRSRPCSSDLLHLNQQSTKHLVNFFNTRLLSGR
ncbi:hypothetical protein DFS34DRAFT_636685, partial [Phlyctochytrium arcticum]